MKIKDSARAWTIRYTRPKNVNVVGPRIYNYNHCSVVIAATVERAVEMLMSEFDDATIISVNPGSTGPVVIDPLVVDESE